MYFFWMQDKESALARAPFNMQIFKKVRIRIMKEFWNVVQMVFAAVGGWLGYFLGGCDGLLYALVAFVVIDYITGVMCGIADRKLNSEVGFKGTAKKILIFLLVGIVNIFDVNVIGTGSVLRTAVVRQIILILAWKCVSRLVLHIQVDDVV